MEHLSVKITKEEDFDEINIHVFLEGTFLLYHVKISNPTRLSLETWRRFADQPSLLLNLTGNQYARINHVGNMAVFHTEAYPTYDDDDRKCVTSEFSIPFNLFRKQMLAFLDKNEKMFEEKKESFGLFD